MNINGGAIGLTLTVALAGLATTLIWRTLMKDQVANMNRIQQAWKSSKFTLFFFLVNKSLCESLSKLSFFIFISGENKRMDESHTLFPFVDMLEKTLLKYDIDAIGCMQTILCTFAHHAMNNVSKGNGTNAEKIFDGAVR